jgi:hypothetical protein
MLAGYEIINMEKIIQQYFYSNIYNFIK